MIWTYLILIISCWSTSASSCSSCSHFWSNLHLYLSHFIPLWSNLLNQTITNTQQASFNKSVQIYFHFLSYNNKDKKVNLKTWKSTFKKKRPETEIQTMYKPHVWAQRADLWQIQCMLLKRQTSGSERRVQRVVFSVLNTTGSELKTQETLFNSCDWFMFYQEVELHL